MKPEKSSVRFRVQALRFRVRKCLRLEGGRSSNSPRPLVLVVAGLNPENPQLISPET